MFKKDEMLKTAILTGFVLFATIGLFSIMMSPVGIFTPAHAFVFNTQTCSVPYTCTHNDASDQSGFLQLGHIHIFG